MTNYSDYMQPTKAELDKFWSEVAAPRSSRLEFNFKERAVTLGLINEGSTTTFIEDDAWEEKVMPLLTDIWHYENRDELEYIILYTDNTFLCQKRKLKYDFSSESSYWVTYEYKECNSSEVVELCDQLEAIVTIQKETELNSLLTEIRELDAMDFYYDAKWYKKKDEINKMLLFSDWRVLPDAPQKFEGERDMWIIWRQKLRDLLPSNPREVFESNFEMFKFVTTVKYPIDPLVYLDKYPDREVEYLSTDDQYDKYDFVVSKDFTSATMMNLIIFMETYDDQIRPINAKILEIAKKLKLEEVYPSLDYNKFIANE